MHRTEGDNKITVGGKNLFTDGPPGTTVTDDIMNALQEEVAGVIEAEGITLQTAATETRDQLNTALDLKVANSLATTPYADFESKDLLIDVATDETVTVTAKRLSFLNSSFYAIFESDVDETFDAATDTVGGLALKASTWYWLWRDSAGVRRLAPDLTSTADGNIANKLSDSAADFVTDLVQVGDELYNLDDLTMGYVGAVDDLNTISCVDADGNDLDLFPDGNEDYIIRMLSPVGLGAYRSRVGAAYSNVTSDFDDSFYAQIQEEKFYSEAAGDFTVTAANWTTTYAVTSIRQVNDWTGLGIWKISSNVRGTVSVGTEALALTHAGVVFAQQQATAVYPIGAAARVVTINRVDSGASTFNISVVSGGGTFTTAMATINALLDKKPTFHT